MLRNLDRYAPRNLAIRDILDDPNVIASKIFAAPSAIL